MRLNRTEKITFSILASMLVFGLMLLTVKVSNINSESNSILIKIANVAQYTDKTALEKTFYYD